MQIFCVQKALRKKEILEADFIITVSEIIIGAPTMRKIYGAKKCSYLKNCDKNIVLFLLRLVKLSL